MSLKIVYIIYIYIHIEKNVNFYKSGSEHCDLPVARKVIMNFDNVNLTFSLSF